MVGRGELLAAARQSAAAAAPSGAVIVALPKSTAPVHQLAETNPHVTMLWFGQADQLDAGQVTGLRQLLQLATSALGPFDVQVAGRAVLGEDGAAVWLVQSQALTNLLLTEHAVSRAVGCNEQFPTWVPHLTTDYSGRAPDTHAGHDLATITLGALGLWVGEWFTAPFQGPRRATVRPLWDDEDPDVLSAAGASYPAGRELRELRLLIRIADRTPAARWLAIKRAAVLGAVDLLPDWPEVPEVAVNVNRRTGRVGQWRRGDGGACRGCPTAPGSRLRRDQGATVTAPTWWVCWRQQRQADREAYRHQITAQDPQLARRLGWS